jgi:hypothetical protein
MTLLNMFQATEWLVLEGMGLNLREQEVIQKEANHLPICRDLSVNDD